VRRQPPPAPAPAQPQTAPTPPAPASAQPQKAPPPRQSGGRQIAAASGQQPRSARDLWAEKADQWHKDPLSLKTPAFAIAENLYYVGNKQFSSHLLVGSKEIVLIDTPYPTHFDMLTESIRSVGVDPKKVTLILHTHGHYDHYGATRRLVNLSGAKTALAAADLGKPTKPHIIEPGVIQRFVEQHGLLYEPFDVDILLKHGDTFDIGGTVIHCHHTPGHTKGTMTFTFDVLINSQKHTAVLWGGPGLHMFKSDQADDWARSFACLKALKADVPLGAHPFINDTLGKYERLRSGEKPASFVDPEGWNKFLEKQEAEFHAIVAKLNARSE
jgi:metallo-beta-lactamase class B